MTTFYATEDLNNIPGLVVKTDGKNNKVLIEEGVKFELSQIIISGDDNVITLGFCNLYHKLSIKLNGDRKNISIGKSNKNIRNLKVTSIRGNEQQLKIGNNFSCGGFELQMNNGNEACYIGDNCLFSWDIKARTSDGHSVIDLSTNNAINLPRDINIGNRVWVGENVYFLKGSSISDNSIVASCSVVTKKFYLQNSVIGGHPAKLLKNNTSWDRRPPYEYNSTANEVQKQPKCETCTSDMKVAVITMVYNEKHNLPIWISHYSKQFPNGELIVVDHSSDIRVSNIQNDVSTIRLPRSPFDDRKRAKFISNLHNNLLDDFDWVIYTDSDELIVSERYSTLQESLANEPHGVNTINCIGLNLFQHIDQEEMIDVQNPIGQQRRYAVLEKSMFKPAISREQIQWTPGFHTSDKEPNFGSNYYLIHLKYIDFEWQRFRTTVASEIEWSKEAVERNWNRAQVIDSDTLMSKFRGVANFIDAGKITEFMFEDEKVAFIDSAMKDSKGNYRIEAEIKSRVLEIPATLLNKLP